MFVTSIKIKRYNLPIPTERSAGHSTNYCFLSTSMRKMRVIIWVNRQKCLLFTVRLYFVGRWIARVQLLTLPPRLVVKYDTIKTVYFIKTHDEHFTCTTKMRRCVISCVTSSWFFNNCFSPRLLPDNKQPIHQAALQSSTKNRAVYLILFVWHLKVIVIKKKKINTLSHVLAKRLVVTVRAHSRGKIPFPSRKNIISNQYLLKRSGTVINFKTIFNSRAPVDCIIVLFFSSLIFGEINYSPHSYFIRTSL